MKQRAILRKAKYVSTSLCNSSFLDKSMVSRVQLFGQALPILVVIMTSTDYEVALVHLIAISKWKVGF